MVGFTQVFGGGNIYPSEPTYIALNISANITMQWPIEQAMAGTNVVADIMDVTASVPGLTVTLPDAREVSTGFTALFNNVGANTVSINSTGGATLVSLVSGTVWQLYLTDNSTAAGTWRVFQFGASVSVAVAAALAGAGLKAIGSTLNERMLVVPQNANYVVLNSDRASVQQWIGGVGTFTLPAAGTVGADWFVVAKNSGSGNLTVNTGGGNIDGNATLVLAPGSSAWFVTDGTNYFSLSSGTSTGGGTFNLIVIDVSGSGTFTLSGGQLNQIGYRFTGALTGNRTIVVPNTTQEYWVDNETTGAFSLSVGTAAQVSPIVVTQGNRNILYCDGTNVVSASTATVVFPITVAQGGTGATTPAAARTNLGSTAVGDSLFTAASVAAAQAAISVPPNTRLINAGAGLTGGGDLTADRTISLNFKGATVQNSAAQFPGVGGAILTWNTDVFNPNGWHNTGVNPSRLTVPAGVTVAEITAVIQWRAGIAGGDNYVGSFSIVKNGATTVVGTLDNTVDIAASILFSITTTTITSGPIAVTPGDYFELRAAGNNVASTQSIQVDTSSLFAAKSLT